MTGSKKDKTTVADVLRDLNEDAFFMPADMVRRELDAAGLNAPERRERTRAFLQHLDRDHKRRSWKTLAAQRRDNDQALLTQQEPQIRQRARELVAAGHPKLLLACSGRRPESMDDDELLSIAEDLAKTEFLGEQDDG